MKRHYPTAPLPAVAGLVVNAEKVLLILRQNPPHVNEWSVPGGAQELGERARDALQREIREETNLIVSQPFLLTLRDLLVYDADDEVKYHYVISYFLVRPIGGTLTPDDDALDAQWYAPSDTISPPLSPTLKALVKCALRTAQANTASPCENMKL